MFRIVLERMHKRMPQTVNLLPPQYLFLPSPSCYSNVFPYFTKPSVISLVLVNKLNYTTSNILRPKVDGVVIIIELEELIVLNFIQRIRPEHLSARLFQDAFTECRVDPEIIVAVINAKVNKNLTNIGCF